MTSGKQHYLSFLLRLWQVKQNGEEVWRALLEDSHTGARHGFASLEALMEFLFQQTQSGEGERQDDQILEKGTD